VANLPFERALDQFEAWLRVEKNLSPRTRAAYRYDLDRLRHFLSGGDAERSVNALDVSSEQLRAYVLHLREDQGIAARTLARTLSSMRVFFAWLVEQGKLEINPTESLHAPRLPRKLPVYLVDHELKKLFAAPDVATPQGLRDRAILLTLAFAGIRLQELVGLNLGDLSFESQSIKVFGKGSKERLVPMNPAVDKALRAWLEVRTSVEGEKAVFTNRFGKRLGGRMVQKLVDQYATTAGLSRDALSPHKLRHTFATLLHSRDVDLVEIQSLLGHASISTTQIYTHTNAGRLAGAVEKLKVFDPGGG
jgi:site-specific recombinase XerC